MISKPRFWKKHNELHIMTLNNRDPDILDHLFQKMCYYHTTSHVVVGDGLLCCMHVELQNGGEPPLTVLEREGEWWFWLVPPGLGPGVLHGPTPLKRLIFASLHLLCPRLAITHSTCLHGSRCGRGGNRSFSTQSLIDRSLCNRDLHNRSLRHRSLSDRSHHSSHTRPTGASGLGI